MKPLASLLCLTAASLALTACEPADVYDSSPESSVAQGASPNVIFRSVQKGNGAGGGSWGELGGYDIQVWEGGTAQALAAGLWFSFYEVDPTSYHCEIVSYQAPGGEPVEFEQCWYTRSTYTYGNGLIPARDVSSKAGRHTAVHTDLTGNLGIWSQTCSWDSLTQIGECTSGTVSGRVDVEWVANGRGSGFNSGVSQYRSGAYSFRSNGTWRASSANFSGEILGQAISGTEGYVHTGLSVTKEMLRGQ